MADDYEEVKELIEADNELENVEFVEFNSMKDLFEDLKVNFESSVN